MEEVVKNLFVKQESQNVAVDVPILDVVDQKLVNETQRRRNLGQDTLNLIKEDYDEPRDQSSFDVILQEAPIKIEDSCSREFVDCRGLVKPEVEFVSLKKEETIIKNEIVVKEESECFENITTTNSKVKQNDCVDKHQYSTLYSDTKPSKPSQCAAEKLFKFSDLSYNSKKPSRFNENQHTREKLLKINSQHVGKQTSNFYELHDTKFNLQQNLQHLAEKPSKCKLDVPKQIQDSKSLKNTIANAKQHNKHTAYDCTISKRRLTYEDRKIHRKRVLHKCSKCEYSSLIRRLLQQHLATHLKAYKCTICNYRASRKQYLDIHMKTHYTPSYKCYECEYMASQRSILTRHFNAVHLNV